MLHLSKFRTRGLLTAAFCLLGSAASAQSTSAWIVRPEWVRAHEEFLASDVLAGRGSATRDEELTASYVASEFIGYGLKTAPGMGGYIQSAEIVSPELDGRSTLSAGNVRTEEGTGFTLMQSGGTPVSGPLIKVHGADVASAKYARGSVVLIMDVPAGKASVPLGQSLRRGGAAMILEPWDQSTEQLYTMTGGKTRLPLRLKDSSESRAGTTLAAINRAQLAQLNEVADGTPVRLVIKALPQSMPRKTFNAIGYLPGSDPNAGTILLAAHLDHLGIGRPVNGDPIYNGANDDAAGTTAVLELAHALALGPKLKRSVLFVCYGSEEAGELGSTYFGEHPPVPLKELVANLEIEMIGNQDPKMPKGTLLLTGYDRSNLGVTLKEHGALVGPDPYPEQHFFERSDNYALALKGVVAHTAAGWGTPPTYHQPSDDLAHLDLPFMTAAIQSLVEPVRWLASSDFVPKWNPGGKPSRN